MYGKIRIFEENRAQNGPVCIENFSGFNKGQAQHYTKILLDCSLIKSEGILCALTNAITNTDETISGVPLHPSHPSSTKPPIKIKGFLELVEEISEAEFEELLQNAEKETAKEQSEWETVGNGTNGLLYMIWDEEDYENGIQKTDRKEKFTELTRTMHVPLVSIVMHIKKW